MDKTKVLIVIDMQNDFINGSLGTKETEAIVPLIVKKIQSWSGELYLTQDTHKADYLSTQEGKYLPVNHCILLTEGWQLHPDIAKVCGPIPTHMKDTFGCKSLIKTLKELSTVQEIGEVQLVGLCTDTSVLSNALLIKAFFPEIPIIVDASCCAGVTPQSHKRALETMKMCQIQIED